MSNLSFSSKRCIALKQGAQLTPEADVLFNTYIDIQPNFADWWSNDFLPNLKVPENILLRSDWSDTDRNLLNTAWMQFRRTDRFEKFEFPKRPNPEPPFTTEELQTKDD